MHDRPLVKDLFAFYKIKDIDISNQQYIVTPLKAPKNMLPLHPFKCKEDSKYKSVLSFACYNKVVALVLKFLNGSDIISTTSSYILLIYFL